MTALSSVRLDRPEPTSPCAVEAENNDESVMVKGPHSVVREIKDKVRMVCKRRRIRLKEFFKPFDAHHNKKVSKSQFKRALAQAGLTNLTLGALPSSDLLTLKEVELLSRRYEANKGGDANDITGGSVDVNYWKFCEQIEKVFVRPRLEKNPTQDVRLSLVDRPESRYGVNRPGLSAVERSDLARLIAQLGHLSRTEGLLVKVLFETFDPRHSGKVTASIFRRQLDSIFKGKLSDAGTRLLLYAYQGKQGDVNYRAMHADCISAELEPPERPQRWRPRWRGDKQVELQLRDQTKGGDNGSGRRQGPSLAACGVFDCSLNEKMVVDDEGNGDESSGAGAPNGHHDGEADGFEVSIEEGQEERSSKQGVAVNPRRFRVNESVQRNPDDSDQGRATGVKQNRRGRGRGRAAAITLSLERQLASKVVYHRLEPRDIFLPLDPTRSGSVSDEVFRRCLSRVFCVPFTQEQLDALAERYREGQNKINYRRLCDHLHGIAENTALGRRFPAPGRSQGSPDEAREDLDEALEHEEQQVLDEALEQMRADLLKRRLSLQDGFQQFDKNSQGYVSVGQLDRVLCSHGVLPPATRVQEIMKRRYATIDDPRHPTGAFIAYRQLLEDLGEDPDGTSGGCLNVGPEKTDLRPRVGYTRNSEKFKATDDVPDSALSLSQAPPGPMVSRPRLLGKPTRSINPSYSVTSDVSMTPAVVLGRRRNRTKEELLAHLKSNVSRSRLRLMEFFRGEDPLRHGTMSRERFGRSLLNAGFRMTPVELEVLCDAYSINTSLDDEGMSFVRYQAFVNEVELVFGIKELERRPECDVDASVRAAQAPFTDELAGIPQETTPLTPEENATIVETLRWMGAQAQRRRLSLDPDLQAYDRLNRGVIPGTMFERALGVLGLLPGRRKTDLLRRKFAERFAADSRLDVNYRAFLAALETIVRGGNEIPDNLLLRAQAAPVSITLSPFGVVPAEALTSSSESADPPDDRAPRDREVGCRACSGGKPESPSLEAVVKEVARQSVSIPKLKVALALAGVTLTKKELECLAASFRGDGHIDLIDWRRLATAVNRMGGVACTTFWNGEVCCPPSADAIIAARDSPEERASDSSAQGRKEASLDLSPPCAPAETALLSASGGNRAEQAVTVVAIGSECKRHDDGDREVVERALDAVGYRVKHYRVYLKPLFQDFDSNRRMRIAQDQFLSVLGNLNLNLSEREQDALCRRYRAQERQPGERIRYMDFCRDVDPETAAIDGQIDVNGSAQTSAGVCFRKRRP